MENFKGIALRQRIDFASLTLLFGPNGGQEHHPAIAPLPARAPSARRR